ncbi:uncharacterized protein Triagg1_9073 [Trichoderma aggressivum f. europaeum]|uniref:Glycine-rich cell wall structural protein 1 n=1 Tax=Trichoderma aggressivum f. europaeum TaxID=173218 RepID=A0AAE1M171_9HYPO|nr:hypothetical protein Triagg1_9073 [Trichoderma aggressivum f. europaeum]
MSSAIETINQLATSAAKAVWGDSSTDETHKEPISGATGDVSKGEPYDAGNLDPKDQNKVESSLKGQQDDSPSDLAENEYYALSSSAKDKPLPESPRTKEPIGGTTLQDNKPKSSIPKDTTTTGTNADDGDDDAANPEQGKSLDELTGAGPRPVEELAKENGGNAAAAAASSGDAVSSSQEENKMKPTEQKLPEDNSQRNDNKKWEATEDDYVKTTGLAADGGNFDAAKPGAGVEADRLMEQKGLKTDDDDNHKAGSSGRKSSDSGRHKDKPSLGERIKNKLHRH